MFKCAAGHQTKAKEKRFRRVVVERAVTYPARAYFAQGKTHNDPGGSGVEAVREADFCAEHVGDR